MTQRKTVTPHPEQRACLTVSGLRSTNTPSTETVGNDTAERLIEPLTARELEVLEWVCDGLSNQEISDRIGVNLATVKFHLVNIFGKLGVKRRTQAVAAGIYLGLIEPGWLHGNHLSVGAHARTTTPMETSTYAA
ncbi:MAG: LuxR C-terminal-related transcriptional regulator [Sinobacteraceae bacterium]|nr:LuxR C-terminal-related transcriptional regulator [Nevskiaceae bacterium]